MKNSVKFLLIASITALMILLNACVKDENKDSYGISKVTTYPVLSLVNEDEITVVYKGSQFSEPGYSAFIGEDDVTNQVKVEGTVNGNSEGMYTLNYTSTNAEGYFISKSRNVFVVAKMSNPTEDDLEGVYKSSITRINTKDNVSANRGPYSQTLTEIAPGLYVIQDLLGGWYWIGSNYGLDYAYDAIISVDNAGVVTLKWVNEHVGWNDGAYFVDENDNEDLSSGVYDADTQTIKFSAKMGEVDYMIFKVTLKK